MIAAEPTPHNLTELAVQVWNDWWWLLFFIVPSVAGGVAAFWDALVHRIKHGGRKELPGRHLRREIVARDRELVQLRRLLAEVHELDRIADPLDPRAITLPTALSREVAEAVDLGDDEPRAVTSRRRR